MTKVYKIGGMGTDVLTGITIRLIGTIGGGLNTGVGMCFLSAGANYQVPVGLTFHATGFIIISSSYFTTGSYYEVRYADDAALTTNPVSMFNLFVPTIGVTIPVLISVGDITAPTGKYVGVFNPSAVSQVQSGCSVFLAGYEQV